MAKKLFDSYKECVVQTSQDVYTQIFSNEWNYFDIEHWMLDTYSIDPNDVVMLCISSVKRYKYGKD